MTAKVPDILEVHIDDVCLLACEHIYRYETCIECDLCDMYLAYNLQCMPILQNI